MKMKKFLATVLAMLLIITVCPLGTFTLTANAETGNTTEFAGGSGTEADPYLVGTKEHLNNVRNYPSSYFKQISNISFSNEDFERGGAFYNFGYGWDGFDFEGTYDGGSFSIVNLQGEEGLFGTVRNAVLKNIFLTVNINFEKDLNDSSTTFGCLARTASNSMVQGCHISGKLNINYINGDYRNDIVIGGIFATVYDSSIFDSSNAVSIKIDTDYGNVYIGGICSEIYGYGSSILSIEASDNRTIIKNCKNTGFLDSKHYDSKIAGITAFCSSGAIIENCQNEGEIADSTDSYYWPWSSAGICASSYGEIKNCENSGKISANYYAGGIITYLCSGFVDNCINYGECFADCEYAGGIVAETVNGSDGCQITNCLNFGKISSNYGFAGGIIGDAYHNIKISKCTNYGNISSFEISSLTSPGIIGAGGIAGRLKSGAISKSKNFGAVASITLAGGICGNNLSTITECYNSGDILLYEDGETAGGIAGKNSGIITNCYNIAEIKTEQTEKINIGGIVGLNSSSVSNCYNVSKIDAFGNYGAICGKNDSDMNSLKDCVFLSFEGLYAVGKGPGDATSATKEAMQNDSCYQNFDFDTIWTMDGNADYPYPELKNVEMIYVPYIPGDIDNVDGITDADAEYLLMFTFFPEDYPVNQSCDFNGDGKVNDADAEHLLMFTFFPEDYPLH